MSPHRRPEATPEGVITDRQRLMRLIHGDEQAWEKLGRPEFGGKAEVSPADYERARLRVLKEGPNTGRAPFNFDEEVWSSASVDAWLDAQHKRLRYLLVNGLLAGEALKTALVFERAHEGREWRAE